MQKKISDFYLLKILWYNIIKPQKRSEILMDKKDDNNLYGIGTPFFNNEIMNTNKSDKPKYDGEGCWTLMFVTGIVLLVVSVIYELFN